MEYYDVPLGYKRVKFSGSPTDTTEVDEPDVWSSFFSTFMVSSAAHQAETGVVYDEVITLRNGFKRGVM